MSETEHQEIEALFSSYYEGDLGADEVARVKSHLADCESCRAGYDEFTKAVEVLSGLGKVSAPAGFEHDVEATIEKRSGGRFFGGRRLTDRLPLTILALIALAIGLAVYWWSRGSETGSLAPPSSSEQQSVDPETEDVLPRPH